MTSWVAPATGLLLATGLAGLLGYSWRGGSSLFLLRYRAQPIAVDLRFKGLEDPLAQLVPELRRNKVRELHVRIVLVGALRQHIVVQGGALLAFQDEPTQIGALGRVHHFLTAQLDAIELPQRWDDDAIGGAGEFAQPNEVVARVIDAAVDNGIHPVVEIRLALKNEKQKRPHGHVAASQRKGIARVGLWQIGWQFESLAVHGIRRLTEGFRQTLDPLAEFWKQASRRCLDESTGALEIPKGHSAHDRLLRMLAVVVHDIAQRHTQANGVKAQLIGQFDDL